MGAFFLAEFCKTRGSAGNTVDGTNGSRVISVEKSCEDVVISEILSGVADVVPGSISPATSSCQRYLREQHNQVPT